MLASVPSLQKSLGGPVQSRKAMLETLCRHLDMVRLSAAGFLMVSLIGCTGLIDGGSDGLSTQQQLALDQWQHSALPVLRQSCATCHDGSRPMVGFLAGGADDLAVHDNLMGYEPAVVNLDAASSSRILTKGLHLGPQLTADQSSALLLWVQAERDAVNHDPDHPTAALATPAAAVAMCTGGAPDSATCPTNHIALSAVSGAGTAVPGAELAFTAQALASGLYLTNLAIKGGTAGVYLEHLLFVSRPTGKAPFPDLIDRYFATKIDVKPGATSPLGGGTEDFIGFAPTDMIEIHVKAISPYMPEATPPPPTQNGCKVLAQFKAKAVPQMNGNCAGCHAGGNPAAKTAMDITGIGSADDVTLQLVCNQVRTRINFQTTDQSGFYLAPDPGSATNHPFKFNPAANFTTFKTSVDVWVQAEKKAP